MYNVVTSYEGLDIGGSLKFPVSRSVGPAILFIHSKQFGQPWKDVNFMPEYLDVRVRNKSSYRIV